MLHVEDEDLVISGFLARLAHDIQQGIHLGTLPHDLDESMLVRLHEPVDLDADIHGDVDL